MKNKSVIGIIIALGILVAGAIGIGSVATRNANKTTEELSAEKAEESLTKIISKTNVIEREPIKANVNFSDNSLAASLPDIDTKYPLSTVSNADIVIEIFSSTEKAGTERNGWLNRAAESFNKQNLKSPDGKTIGVSIRKIASGAAVDYIVTGVHTPDGYTPSNSLLGDMTIARGGTLNTEVPTLLHNTAGIIISNAAYDTISTAYGDVTVDTVIKAVTDNQLAFGYTYPYTSATGLNFLVTAMQTFDNNNMLSDTAIKQLQTFQSNIPFVCYTTDQMVTAMNSGSLQAGVIEYQQYYNDAQLSRSYKFIPFGYTHDNPLYSVGNLSPEKQFVMDEFKKFLTTDAVQNDATSCGFNIDSYKSSIKPITGSQLVSIQETWKKEKNTTTPIAAVFIADISGSMTENNAIGQLKDALLGASQNINPNNYIGIISYDDDVYINLPIKEFNLEQRGYFTGAVSSLSPGGSTATYDALAVAIDQLTKFKASNPNVKPLIFLLSDGKQNVGANYEKLDAILHTYKIPVYTISYNAVLPEMESLATINEAVHITADNSDVIYTLTSLFNAQM